jgi:hypothetical protein
MRSPRFFACDSIFLLSLFAIWQRSTLADESTPPPQQSQSSGAADQLETVHLVLHAAEPSYAALKIRLLPIGIDQTPGNAAPQYFRAAMAWNNDKAYVDALSKIPDWSELSLKELGQNEEAQKFFNSTSTDKWELIRFAARKEYCEWDLPLREYTFATHIPELQKMRELARLLAFKARIEISRGQFDNAIETIQSGFAIARHAAQGQTLINGLVGFAIAGIMFNQVQELMQQPHCPNLYWSLSALPNPFVDLRPGLEFEQDCLYFFIPQLRDIRQVSHSEAVWDTMLLQVADKMIKVMSETSGNNKDLDWFGKGALFAVTAYPKAKQQLQDAGYTRSQIDAMPASQAILTATVETFEHERDEIYKWLYSSSPEAFAGLAEAGKHLSADSEVIPVASLLLPSLVKVKDAEVRSQRELAALRCVEAMRWYAFQHHNQLPQQLSDIKDIPLPNDPMTGQPFSYELNDGRALIISPAPPGEPAVQGLRWEIQLAAGRN